jgi:hypothetical protein
MALERKMPKLNPALFEPLKRIRKSSQPAVFGPKFGHPVRGDDTLSFPNCLGEQIL